MKFLIIPAILSLSVLFLACDNTEQENQVSNHVSSFTMGELPPQSESLIQQEFDVYRRQHPEMDEATARHEFDIIQKMSAQISDPERAAWAERKALSRAWVKAKIEDVYAPNTVSDEMVQQAIDAYAFKSGHPALVTASHILIRPDSVTTPEMRRQALENVRQNLLKLETIHDEDLRHEAIRLTHAGFRTDMNADLTFPKRPMVSFFGERLGYQAVVEPFADAAFALTEQNPLSDITESEFGYHLILFKSRTEEKKASLPEDREFIVNSIVDAGRNLASRQGIEEVMNKQDILFDEARLKEIAK